MSIGLFRTAILKSKRSVRTHLFLCPELAELFRDIQQSHDLFSRVYRRMAEFLVAILEDLDGCCFEMREVFDRLLQYLPEPLLGFVYFLDDSVVEFDLSRVLLSLGPSEMAPNGLQKVQQ